MERSLAFVKFKPLDAEVKRREKLGFCGSANGRYFMLIRQRLPVQTFYRTRLTFAPLANGDIV